MYRTYSENEITMESEYFESDSFVDTFSFVRKRYNFCRILTLCKDNSIIDWSKYLND